MDLLIKEIKKEAEDTFSIIFQKPEGFRFYPGQYLDLTLPITKKQDKVRSFTISSSPTEKFLMITTKKGISNFKLHLQALKPGDSLTCNHPAGTFTLDNTQPAVFLAGGIGITPFRSIIKAAVDRGLDTPIFLIYSNHDEDFIFKSELCKWQKEYSSLKIYYHKTYENGHLNLTKLKKLIPSHIPLPIFYLSGPIKMVENFKTALLKLGVDSTNIRVDMFEGY